jgi:hypothetical protein
MRHPIFYLVIAVFLIVPASAPAEDLEIVNRPVNASGLTGLLITTAPYTLAPGDIEVGAAVLSESSVEPDFTLTEYPLSVTVGLKRNSELALRASYINLKQGPTGTAVYDRIAGDLELAYKWNFLPQAEYSMRPAVSLILGARVPTGNNTDAQIDVVNHLGVLLGLSAGTEIRWRDHILGLHGDARLIGRDPAEERLRDIYRMANAGIAFPISKNRNLQILLEYTLVQGRDRIYVDGGDYSALTYGFRLVSERFNLTVGTQFLRKKLEEFDNSGKVTGLMSMKF